MVQREATGLLDAVANPVRLAIVRHLVANGPSHLSALARAATASRETARRHVHQLEHAGVVEAIPAQADGATRGRPPVRYRLVERAQATGLQPGAGNGRQAA